MLRDATAANVYLPPPAANAFDASIHTATALGARTVNKNVSHPGERFARQFRTDRHPLVLAKPPTKGGTAIARLVCSQAAHCVTRIPAQRAFVILLPNRELRHTALWIDGCPRQGGVLREGEIGVFNLRYETVANLESPFDFLYVYIPHLALENLAAEYDAPRITECVLPPGVSARDPVMTQLASCLQPELEQPDWADDVYTDHVMLALQVHFAKHYGGMRIESKPQRGLAPWQLRRAKEILSAHIVGSVSVAQLAAECRLSTCHFARSFRHSAGISPHRWLMHRRVERATELLEHSRLSITDIALSCGFADQSHLTRVFRSVHGSAPGRWRRAADPTDRQRVPSRR
jgi:AraC family transcriptional regulator